MCCSPSFWSFVSRDKEFTSTFQEKRVHCSTLQLFITWDRVYLSEVLVTTEIAFMVVNLERVCSVIHGLTVFTVTCGTVLRARAIIQTRSPGQLYGILHLANYSRK